jgi:2-succinyl-6-hydroxy-2,4-cyclohexadiene-1-carboxylate synthase
MGSEASIVTVPIAGSKASLTLHKGSRKACPTIIALHGFTGSGADFLSLRDALGSDRFNWVCPDFMGHGASDSPRNLDPYLLTNTLKLVDAARRAAPNPEQVFLLGYSMGGRVALNYLRWATPLPTIVIGASPGIADAAGRTARQIRDRQLIQQGTRIEDFCRVWEAQPLIAPQTRLPEPLNSKLAARRRRNNLVGLRHSLLATGSGFLPDLWEVLPSLPPVHCLFGKNDPKFADLALRMRERNPHFEALAVPDSGHAPHLEAPGALARLLEELLLSR